MRTEVLSPAKRPSPASKAFRVGDRVTFRGSVLRVLQDGERKTLLILVEGNGVKLMIAPEDIKGGAKLKGGDPVTLTGAVTRVGSSLVDELSPISLAVDGYTAMRVTLAKKSLRRA